ncbi:class E sortase [Cellulomonas hominis]|uniref:class E sortase n=1 Tax=Cellulomonas hominis TaxID=156981 RepID=UPI001C1244C6|nr:class E sortase [Cellulomonas hominis]MBU5421131.1 class E sortase [Cellulomonas hominis]
MRGLVGVVGELLLTAGVILGLFLVWQLWWTSVEAQGQAETVMAAYLDTLPPSVPTAGQLRTDAPPVPEAGAYGQTTGVLTVPRWEGRTRNAMPIVEGIDKELLDQALAGHYPDTQQVGEVGNFALAGHRRTYGDSFRYVNELQTGDQIIVETAQAWYVYEVSGYEIVLPTQTEVIAPVPGRPGVAPTERILTLTTCTTPSGGEYGNSHRWITYATFAGWMDRADGTPEQVIAAAKGS